eukprot:7980161-Heterocapsa_arctica.AAC.1
MRWVNFVFELRRFPIVVPWFELGVMGVHDCCLGVRVYFPGVPMFKFPRGAGFVVKHPVLRLDLPNAPFRSMVWRFHRCTCFLVFGRGINAFVRVLKV